MVMNDGQSIMLDAQYEEKLILEKNAIVEDYCFEDAKRLKLKVKINEQPPLVQKYWLGRLAYELAIRNEHVKEIYENSKAKSEKKDLYAFEEYSPREKYLILNLDPYGFTSQPEDNVLKTEHTSFPVKLFLHDEGHIEINTIQKISKLISIIDGASAKKFNLNTSNHQKWLNIGQAYLSSYLQIIHIEDSNNYPEEFYDKKKFKMVFSKTPPYIL
jgi:hypothetical protein